MKRILLSILAVVYLIASIGVIINVHYCMGKQASLGFGIEQKQGCGICGMDNKCCHTDSKYVKVTDDQQAKTVQTINHPVTDVSFIRLIDYTLSTQGLAETPATVVHDPPGNKQRPLSILYCVFRV